MAEQKTNPNEPIQLLICDSHDLSLKKIIEIGRSSLSEVKLLEIAKAELNMAEARKIYCENGQRLTASNVHKVENNDALYVSDGSTLEKPFESIRLSVMGAGAVGKSALTLRFIQ